MSFVSSMILMVLSILFMHLISQPKEIPKKKKESYRPPPPPPRVKTPAEKQSLIIPEHMKEALGRRDSESKNELENELMRSECISSVHFSPLTTLVIRGT